jgi:hypothetical protein
LVVTRCEWTLAFFAIKLAFSQRFSGNSLFAYLSGFVTVFTVQSHKLDQRHLARAKWQPVQSFFVLSSRFAHASASFHTARLYAAASAPLLASISRISSMS